MRPTPCPCFAAAILAAVAVPAQVDELLSVSTADGELRRVSLVYTATVGTVRITRSTGGDAVSVHGLARDPATGALRAVVTFAGSAVREFCALDAVTGVATVIAPAAAEFVALAWRDDGVLFAVSEPPPPAAPALYTIDPATGVAAVVAALPAAPGGTTMTFAADGFLYRASGRGQQGVDERFERRLDGSGAPQPIVLGGDDYDGLTVLTPYTGRLLLGVDCADVVHALTTGGHVRAFGALDHGHVSGLVFVPAPDTVPFFRQYGDGCPGSSGAQPMLTGCGHPSGGHSPGVHLRFAPPNAALVLAAGSGDGTAPFPSAECTAHVLPAFWFATEVADAGGNFNRWFPVPAGTPPLDLYFQFAVLDGASLRTSNPVRMHVR